MPFCLPKQFADKMKLAFKKGDINPDKLNRMTSAERRAVLAKIVGEENAKQLNLFFEQKLLLKNQERAMYDWASSITGMNKEAKASTLEKIRATYADKARRLHEPAENEAFLNEIVSDIYSKKFKTEVTLEEAQTITELTRDMRKAQAKMSDDFTWKSKGDGLEFGASKVALDNYTGVLKAEATKDKFINPLKAIGVDGKVQAFGENARIAVNFIADNSRALKASFDNSFWGRQGFKVMLNPKYSKVWAKNFGKSFKDIYKTLKGGNKAGDAVIDATKAEIYSRKNYLNGNYKKGTKLDIGIIEEEFPTSLPSKIPGLGRGFKASEVAYEAGAIRLRADLADKMYSMAGKVGVDMTDKVEVGAINQLINSMTGRGKLNVAEGSQQAINKAFFSVKFFKSNLDFLLNPKTAKSVFARKEAAKHLLTVGATTTVILGIADKLWPGSVEWDPRSSNFGQIKMGNIKYDITGGARTILIALARISASVLGKKSFKSSTTGILTNVNDMYGRDGMGFIWDFVEGKFSPLFSQLKEIINKEQFGGGKPTKGSVAKGLAVPIVLENIEEFKDEKVVDQLIGFIADGLGISANLYKPTAVWNESTSQEMTQFKEKVGQEKFNEANDRYNKEYNEWLQKAVKNVLYQAQSDDKKRKIISQQKAKIKKQIFKDYGFKKETVKSEELPLIN